ncbi:MAG: 50S ribosomal protein L1 [Candidatus Aenigmarchaeota archaeon]|nr:50S ribosomal protein L1 [Candidatus Aenigmarchaeota archaeon]
MTVLEKIKEIREKSKKRNFNQRFDLVINLKELDMKKAESKIDELFALPKGIGKDASITLFSDSVKKMEGCTILSGSEMEKLSKDKKEIKKLIGKTDFFLAEPKLMIVAGKHLGKFLAPKGKMPKPVTGNVEKTIEDTKKSIRISVIKTPIIHTVVGSEKMDDKDLEENIKALINFLKNRLPKGKNNIKNVYLKLTMSHPIKLEVE